MHTAWVTVSIFSYSYCNSNQVTLHRHARMGKSKHIFSHYSRQWLWWSLAVVTQYIMLLANYRLIRYTWYAVQRWSNQTFHSVLTIDVTKMTAQKSYIMVCDLWSSNSISNTVIIISITQSSCITLPNLPIAFVGYHSVLCVGEFLHTQ